MLPQRVDIPGTCAHIVIEKTDATTGAHIGGATFKITPDPAPGARVAA